MADCPHPSRYVAGRKHCMHWNSARNRWECCSCDASVSHDTYELERITDRAAAAVVGTETP